MGRKGSLGRDNVYTKLGDGTTVISMNDGRYRVLVDTAVEWRFRQYRWFVRAVANGTLYVRSTHVLGHWAAVNMKGPPNRWSGMRFVNGDTLDLRLNNLQVLPRWMLLTHARQRKANTTELQQYRNIHASRSGWRVDLRLPDGTRKTRRFATIEEAKAWRDATIGPRMARR